MLVLWRKPLEDIIVHRGNDEIIFRVAKVRGNTVWMAVDAPDDWEIDRREVYQVKRLEAEMQGRDANKDGNRE